MRKYISVLTIMVFAILSSSHYLSAAEKSYSYKSYSAKSKKVKEETFVQIEEMKSGEKKYKRQTQGSECLIKDEMVLDEDYNVKTWHRFCKEQGTDFTAHQQDNVFIIQGKFKGEEINKTIDLKDKFLYIIPQLSLSYLALSDLKELKFSTLRRDELERLSMQAKHKGEEVIDVNGKKEAAFKVYYAATGIREKYYNRIYYYRKTDGIFLKKVEPNGEVEELVSELYK